MTGVVRSTNAGAEPRPRVVPRLVSLLSDQLVILLLVLAAMVAVFSTKQYFFSNATFGNILLDWGPLVLLAIGETFVIISGGIDLSVGTNAAFTGVMAALVMRSLTRSHHDQWFTLIIGLLVAMAVGTGVGLVNAFLILRARIVPFVATLATYGALGGLAIVYTHGAPIAGGPADAIKLSVPKYGPLSKPGLIVIAICITAGLFLHAARFGRYTFALGSNAFAARAAGINVRRHTVKVYALSGFLAGLAGMYFYLRLGSGAPTSGKGMELDAIAAVVIGGTSLSGGVGRLSCTIVAALMVATLKSGLIFMNVAPDWTPVVVAILIALAAYLQGFTPQIRRPT